MSLQVYEHVYETVDINSSPEVRANATAKVDPSQIILHKYLTFAHSSNFNFRLFFFLKVI